MSSLVAVVIVKSTAVTGSIGSPDREQCAEQLQISSLQQGQSKIHKERCTGPLEYICAPPKPPESLPCLIWPNLLFFSAYNPPSLYLLNLEQIG